MPSGMQFVGDIAGFSPKQAVLLTKDENESSLSAGVGGLVLGLSACGGHCHRFLRSHWDTCSIQMRKWRLGEDKGCPSGTHTAGVLNEGGRIRKSWGIARRTLGSQ